MSWPLTEHLRADSLWVSGRREEDESAMPATNPTHRELAPKARASLSSDRILDTAMKLALRSQEPLSLSRLGRALNADPTALYRHFRSRDELILAMAERVHEDVCRSLAVIPAELPCRDRIAAHARTLRSNFLRYPSLAYECAHRVTGGVNEARGARWMIDRLVEAGFEPAEAVGITRGLAELIFGSIAATAGILTMPPTRQRQELARLRAVYRGIMAPDTGITAVDAESFEADLDKTFHDAIELMLDGLEQRLASTGASP